MYAVWCTTCGCVDICELRLCIICMLPIQISVKLDYVRVVRMRVWLRVRVQVRLSLHSKNHRAAKAHLARRASQFKVKRLTAFSLTRELFRTLAL